MWHEVRIALDSGGVGNGNLIRPEGTAEVFAGVMIPPQAAITSGATDIVISTLLPNLQASASAILTLTNVVTPYEEVVQTTPVNEANVAQTNYVYRLVQSLNVSITGGVALATASVWILLSD